eukprot:CAMPEP_0177681774 /NCGR_PEP_ID=MMETSP0447-20121125/30903_1 /TAXON_ID=0 /ORGANISM="Stygamoeba regulata, Strain BSH-02190019" /LENGTH=685 /DNA_ID=CAMNT_0019191229 /DNA_START=78 /DNA_END=2136 /DNA_ORIENTATION=+
MFDSHDKSSPVGFLVRKLGGSAALIPLTLLIGVKVLRIVSMNSTSNMLHLYNFPVPVFVFFQLVFAAVWFFAFHRRWLEKALSPGLYVRIGVYASVLAFNVCLLTEGLKHYGPIRTVLSSDYSELMFVYLLGTMMLGKPVLPHKLRGTVAVLVGYMCIFWLDPMSARERHIVVDPSSQVVVDHVTSQNPLDIHLFGLISIPEAAFGGVCVALSVLSATFLQKLQHKLAKEVGDSKQLMSIAFPMASVVLLPFAILSYATSDQFEAMSSVVASAFCGLVLNFYIELRAHSRLPSSTVVQTSLCTSFVFLFLWDLLSGSQTYSVFTFIAFGLVLYGFSTQLSQRTAVVGSPLPFNAVDADLSRYQEQFRTHSFMHMLSDTIREINGNPESRSIFYFLLINLAFMFVEMIYGIWSNSLGLISDACHMLFDCTALAIGLYASVISRWSPTSRFSYGFARVQTLSGFVNAVFLVFIAFTVFGESIARVMDPPDINTDRLILVSFLGLLVNMIGIFAFSHAHSHSHGGGDGHGHSCGSSDNMTGVYLHVLADTLGSVGVIISSIMVWLWNWTIADPICSLLISIGIFASVVELLKSSAQTLLQKTPDYLEEKMPTILLQLKGIDGVLDVVDPHFWNFDGGDVIGSVHLLLTADAVESAVRSSAARLLMDTGVKRVTVQVEKQANTDFRFSM